MINGTFALGNHRNENDIIEIRGIPFSVERKDDIIQPFKYANHSYMISNSIKINKACVALFFLGMVTDKPECSEWWGQSERYHYHGTRLFIGDRVARINVYYADDTMETIPVIFGVNVWPYELLNTLKENENGLNNFDGPYPEPFASDPAAKKLLYDSLILMDNNSEKAMNYIFGLKVKQKTISEVTIYKEPYREAGVVVSAVTGLIAGNGIDPAWKLADPDFFLRKEYFAAMDKLARRLYQFRDEIPTSTDTVIPDSYSGPRVKFAGSPAADIFANVFHYNLHDMAANKVDEKGMSHTSSCGTLNFGCYIGLGTFKKSDGYYAHIWTRDIGRILIELARTGIRDRLKKAVEIIHGYLYDGCIKYKQPHWMRIANGARLNDDNLLKSLTGKENDGHAAIMLSVYNLYQTGIVDAQWLKDHKKDIEAAAQWFIWQIDHPAESNFDRVLCSESEASTQIYGGYDLFSNTSAYYALKGYERLATAFDDTDLEDECRQYALIIRQGIMDRFVTVHSRYGRIFVDTTDDAWTWEYKRFAPLFLLADIFTYDPAAFDDEWYQICRNTYKAQKEDYFSYAAGRQMGYGQGYLTETALLLDEYEDIKGCIEQAALFCYHHTENSYIVPEGVIMHPSGRFWFRNCDLGNAVQQGEIIKCARLLIGMDDLNPEKGLSIIPRLPGTWSSIKVDDYKVISATDMQKTQAFVKMEYKRIKGGYALRFSASQKIKVDVLRFGPFSKDTVNFNTECGYACRQVEYGGIRFVYVDIKDEISDLDVSIIKA